jgi:hypothetical protein
MAIHKDFQIINDRLVKQFGEQKGNELFSAWLSRKEFDATKPFLQDKERKEKYCSVRGLEIKETGEVYHVEGLIATDHIDEYDKQAGIAMPDYAPISTLEAWANQINTRQDARVMGVHHSEGRPINPEYFGMADVENSPAKVVRLSDGHNGLYVDTKLLSHDPKTPEIIRDFQSGKLNSFSITYDVGNEGFDFDVVEGRLVRVLTDKSELFGYTAASNPVNPQAIATRHGFKEFKELIIDTQLNSKEVKKMEKEVKEDVAMVAAESTKTKFAESKAGSEEPSMDEVVEMKEFHAFKANKKALEEKEALEKNAEIIAGKIAAKMEVKEKVLKDNAAPGKAKEISFEMKEYMEARDNTKILEIKQQFSRAGALCESIGLDWQRATNTAAEGREYKSFGIAGRNLEFKGLGVTTNQNSDTDYLQSSAELQDVYDPIIYNALNQATKTWNILAKDDFSKKGNNQVQFTLKIAANSSASFYTGNAVATDNVTRLKYQTKFKKLQVGVSVDGDMIAAARGGPVSDVFAQEVMDSTMDMLAVLNAALFAEKGLETAAEIIGFEYIADSAGNTTLYSLTRSAANKLSPDAAGDTYINQASTVISMTNLRAAIRQCVTDGSNKRDLAFITSPTQGDMLRGKFDDSRRMLTARDTDFGFSTDLFVDGIPVFEDKDCNSDDWFCVDLSAHRVGMWIPPTIERLGKSADSEDAFIKMYLATYNRAPRRLVMIYGCATA